MTNRTNSFEGVTPSGTALTAGSAGNTGGTSGDWFDTVNLGGTGVITSDSTHAAHGSLGCHIVTGGTASLSFVAWTTQITGQASAQEWFRIYVYLTATPSANLPIGRFLTSGAAQCARLVILSTGKLTFNDAGNTVQITSTMSMPTGAWFRIEGYCKASATAGQLEFRIYSTMDAALGSYSEIQTSGSALNTGASIGQFQTGVTSVAVASASFWLDDVGVSDTAYIGPVSTATTWSAVGTAPATSSATGTVYLAPAVVSGSSATSMAGDGTVILPGGPFVVATGLTTGSGTSRTATVSTPSNAGDTLLALVTTQATGCTISALTDSKGNIYTLDRSFVTAVPLTYAFRSQGATGGPGGGATAALVAGVTPDTITATSAASAGNVQIMLVDVPAGTLDQLSSMATGTSTAPAVSATPTGNGETCVVLMSDANAGGAPTIGSPFSLIATYQTGVNPFNAAASNRLAAGTGSGVAQNFTATITSAAWRAVMYTFNPVPTGTVYTIAGSAASVSSANGTATLLGTLAGSAATLPSAAGTVSLTAVASGSSRATPAASGTIYNLVAINGTAPSVSSATGNVFGEGFLPLLPIVLAYVPVGAQVWFTVGTATAISHGDGNVSIPVTWEADGLSASSSAGSGWISLTTTYQIAGSGAAASSGSGWVSTAFGISGSAPATASANGTLALRGAVVGTAPAVSAANGTLSMVETISGSSANASTGDGVVTPPGMLYGSSVGTVAANGTMTMIAIVAGSAPTASAASGTITRLGVIAGTAANTSPASGTIFNTITISGSASATTTGNGWVAFVAGPSSGFSDTTTRLSGAGTLTQKMTISGLVQMQPLMNAQFIPLTVAGPLIPVGGSMIPVSAQWLNTSLQPQGLIPFNTLSATLYYNQVSSWSMTVPYSDALWAMIQQGDFIVHVDWMGLFSFGGKCETPGYSDSIPGAGGGSSAGPYITLAGADYLGLIANRIAYPSPAVAWSAQTAAAADSFTGPLESAIKHFVTNNVGSGAVSARRLSFLDIGTDNHQGPSVQYSAKFQQGVDLNLMNIIRSLINGSSPIVNMGVSVTLQSNNRLLFDCYVPRDLTTSAWFSERLGNLTAVGLTLPDPTVTDALVQGASTFFEATATGLNAWNRIEDYVDQTSETNTTLVQQAGYGALGGGAAGPTLSMTATDMPFLTFGRDYKLGDKVTIEVRPGVTYQDIITSVALTVDPAQNPAIQIVPTIGYSADPSQASTSYLAQLAARIRYIEQRLNRRSVT